MKLDRIVHKVLTCHMNRISQSENKNIYFVFALEIYHYSKLLKIERKSGKYLMRWHEYLSTTFSLQNDA